VKGHNHLAADASASVTGYLHVAWSMHGMMCMIAWTLPLSTWDNKEYPYRWMLYWIIGLLCASRVHHHLEYYRENVLGTIGDMKLQYPVRIQGPLVIGYCNAWIHPTISKRLKEIAFTVPCSTPGIHVETKK